jgi:hypothetical protein
MNEKKFIFGVILHNKHEYAIILVEKRGGGMISKF